MKMKRIFNFNTSYSIPDYQFFVPDAGTYQIVLNSDEAKFGGFDRVDMKSEYNSIHDKEHGVNYLKVYIPNRTALILKKKA